MAAEHKQKGKQSRRELSTYTCFHANTFKIEVYKIFNQNAAQQFPQTGNCQTTTIQIINTILLR